MYAELRRGGSGKDYMCMEPIDTEKLHGGN